MVPRKLISILVIGLPVLATTLAVLLGVFLVVDGLGDRGGALLVRGFAIAGLVALIVDVLLLVGALGINHLDQTRELDEHDFRGE